MVRGTLSTRAFQKKSNQHSTLLKDFVLKILKSNERIKKKEHQRVADDENEQPFVRSHAHENVAEDIERANQAVRDREQLEQEREQIAERLPLRERLKDLFKKHGLTIATVVTAVGITIGDFAKFSQMAQVLLQMA